VSTILKALQRLEDEKSANSERSLDEQIVAHRPSPDPERRGLKIGVVAIGGLAVAAVVFLIWLGREESDAEVAMEPPPLATAPATAAAPPDAPAATTKVAAEKPRRRPSARPAPAAPAGRAQQGLSEVEISSVVEVVKHLDAPPADSAARAAPSTRATPATEAGTVRPGRRPSARKPEPQVASAAAGAIPAPKQVDNAKPPATQISENAASAKSAPVPSVPVEVAAVDSKPAPVPSAPVEVAAVDSKPAPVPSAPVEVTAITPKLAPASPPPVEVTAVTPKLAPASPPPVEIAAAGPKPALIAASASIPAAIRESENKVVQRAKVPALSVEKTIWHPDADRRVAVVKLIDDEGVLRLKEGDAIGPLVIKTINPGSVLFNHDGIEITYNVGS